MALLSAGAASVVLTTLLSMRLNLTYGGWLALDLMAAIGALTLITMLAENPAAAWSAVKRISPLIVFAVCYFALISVSAFRMNVALQAVNAPYRMKDGYGLSTMMSSWHGALAIISSAVLGYATRRSTIRPLMVVAVAVGISVAVGLLGWVQDAGLATPVGDAYVDWSAAIGSWSPGVNEPFRSVGLDIDPNTYGLIGLLGVAFVVALSDKNLLRGSIGALSALVVVLSGSRTAVAGVVFVFAAWFFTAPRARLLARERFVQLRPVLIGVAAAMLIAGIATAATGGADSIAGRLTQTSAAVKVAATSGVDQAVDDAATGGRLVLWSSALSWWRRFPMGAFVTPEVLVGRSIHNEYLTLLLQGGPLMLAILLGVQLWLLIKVRPSHAPALGPVLFAVYATAAMTLGPTMLAPFLGLAFYLIGWSSGQPRVSKELEAAKQSQAKAA